LKRWWSGVFVAATMVVAACLDYSTDPDEVVAIAFDPLPWPSVVAGDTLRDASGAAAPLVARLFNGDGEEITGPVEFFTQQPTIDVVSGDFLVADDTATGSAGVFASAIGVQSIAQTVEIVEAPDSLQGGPILPLEWVVPDDPATNTSSPLAARVLSSANAGVRSWVVRFQLEVAGRTIPENDTTQAFLVGDNGRPSYADTTDASGTASRRMRLRITPGLVPPDSAVITVSGSHRGVPLKGSPVRLVLPVRPDTANISKRTL
jgi:hypothetical protein